MNVNNVKVDTVTECCGCGKLGIDNCSGAPSSLAHTLRTRKVRIRCRSSVGCVPASISRALIMCAPTVPGSVKRLMCIRRGNWEIVGHSEVLNRVTRNRRYLTITNARKGAAADALLTRVFRSSKRKYSTFLKNVSGGRSAGLLIDSGPMVITRTSRFSESFLRLFPSVTIVASVSTSRLSVCSSIRRVCRTFETFTSRIDNALVAGVKLPMRPRRASTGILECSCGSPTTSFCTSSVIISRYKCFAFSLG